MNGLLDCSICKKISSYDIVLSFLELQNNKKDLPKTIGIGIGVKYLELEFDENNITVPIAIKLIGVDKQEDDESEVIEDKNVLFRIEVAHKVQINLNTIESLNEAELQSVKDYAYFVLYPTLKETIASIAAKIGLFNIDIPKRVRDDGYKD